VLFYNTHIPVLTQYEVNIMRNITTIDTLETAINAGAPIGYGADLIEENRTALSIPPEEEVSRPIPQKFEFISPQHKDLLASLLAFTATIFLTKAVSPENFKDAVMPLSLNVSTGLSAFLKFHEVLEKNGCGFLPKKMSDHLVKAAYMILMNGLSIMEIESIDAFINNDASAINRVGLFAVTGFTLFSGIKFPGVVHTAKENFFIELGLNVSSLGFLFKSMMAAADAKQNNNVPEWRAALYLIFASVGFILSTAYEIYKSLMAWNALTATERLAELPKNEGQSAHVALSTFSERHNEPENGVDRSQTITPSV